MPASDLVTIDWPNWGGGGNLWGGEVVASVVWGWNEEGEEYGEIELIDEEWTVLNWDTTESDVSGVAKRT